MDASNDNPRPGLARPVRIIGQVDAATGRVTITDRAWRPAPRAAPQLRLVAGHAPLVD